MKTTIKILVVFLLIVSYSCKEKIDIEKEKDAVMAVIMEETAAYYANDFDRWSAVHVQDSTLFTTGASRSGFGCMAGWQAYSEDMRPVFVGEKGVNREEKIPLMIKIYGESAWVVIMNNLPDEQGGLADSFIAVNFLEKHDGKWVIAYRNRLNYYTYSQADGFLINSINYAKSLGKSVEDIAAFTGDQYKTVWDQSVGYDGFVSGMLSNWSSMVRQEEFKVVERDDNHIVFSVNNIYTGLKASPQFNVTYDDYLLFMKITGERIGEHMGAAYQQETTQDRIRVTISRK